MKKLLLIMGDLAAGKSTFAIMLSRRYNINVFFKDSIKEVLGDTIGFSNREENRRLSSASMEMMFFLFSEFAVLNKSLILESNFHTAELDRLHQLAAQHDYQILTIVLRGNVRLLHQRYLNRIAEKRHPVHLSTTMDKYEDFERYTEWSRQERIPGETIVVNADDFSWQTDIALLAKIDCFLKG